MLGKLIKYEFRSMSKVLYIIWIIIPLASILYGIAAYSAKNSDYYDNAMQSVISVSTVVYMTLFLAMAIVTLVIIISRFYKGVLGTEGYLVNTLPVRSWEIITSKGIVSTLVTLIGCIISVLAIFIIGLIMVPFQQLISSIQNTFGEIFSSPQNIKFAVELLVVMLFTLIATIYQIYTSLSIGQLVTKNRILMALLTYFLLNVASTIINELLSSVFATIGTWSIASSVMQLTPFSFGLLGMLFYPVEGLRDMSGYFIWSIAALAIKIIVFHIVTNYIIKNKLNLE